MQSFSVRQVAFGWIVPMAIMIPMYAVATAHASPTCQALFSESEQIVRELSLLRVSIAAKRAAGQADVAKVLYSKYQEKVVEAQRMGIDTSLLSRKVAEGETQRTNERESESRRAREARNSEQGLHPWVKAHTISDPLLEKFYPIQLSPDGQRVAYKRRYDRSDFSLVFKDIASGNTLAEYKLKDLSSFDIDWQRDIMILNHIQNGKYLHRIYSISTGKALSEPMPLGNIDLHPTRPVFAATVDEKASLVVYNYQTGQVEKVLKARPDFEKDSPRSPLFSPDGRYVVVDSEGLLEIFDLTNDTKHDYKTGERMAVAFVPNSHLLAVPRFDGNIEIADISQNLKVLKKIPTSMQYPSVKFDSTGERMILKSEHAAKVISMDGNVLLHNFRSADFVWTASAEKAPAFAFQAGDEIQIFSPPQVPAPPAP